MSTATAGGGGFHRMSFHDVLEDLQTRFIINVPLVELSSIERICFQIEQAHWFYEDFVREVSPSLPSLSLKNFSAHFFKQCPLLVNWASDHEEAFATFMEYKVRVPVCGAIILNEKLDKVLLVRGWKSKSGWGFPKGKINKEEPEAECAIREVLEETGYDIRDNLVQTEHVERTMKEQRIRLYVIRGVPESTEFLTQTRKEIGDIRWFALKDLPGYSENSYNASTPKFYMVVAFMGSLKKWIQRFKASKKTAKVKQKKAVQVANRNLNHPSGNTVGYKSQNEADSESDFPSADVGPLNNQDNEDWGVNTLHQATDLIKSMIGIGTPSSNPHRTQQIPNTVPVHQYPQHSQVPPVHQHQMYNAGQVPHAFYNQQSSFPQFQSFSTFPGQNSIFQNTPLQGIITTADGTNTHAMIQILPFSPTNNGLETPQPIAQTQVPSFQSSSRNNSVHSLPAAASTIVDQFGHKWRADATSQAPRQQPHRHSVDLKTMPPPPKVEQHVDTMSEEIRASYGGGGGGPTVNLGKLLGTTGERLQASFSSSAQNDDAVRKKALMSILTKGTELRASGSETPTTATPANQAGSFQSASFPRPPSSATLRTSLPDSAVPPSATYSTSSGVGSYGPIAFKHDQVGAGVPGVVARTAADAQRDSDDESSDIEESDFSALAVKPIVSLPKRDVKQHDRGFARVSESVKDPWAAVPVNVVANAQRMQTPSAGSFARSGTKRTVETASEKQQQQQQQQQDQQQAQKQQQPQHQQQQPQQQHQPSAALLSQNLMDILRGGPQQPASSVAQSTGTSAINATSQAAPIALTAAGTAPSAPKATNAPSLMDILTGNSQTPSTATTRSEFLHDDFHQGVASWSGIGGGGGPRFLPSVGSGSGGGGGGGLALAGMKAAPSPAANTNQADALRAILGIPSQNPPYHSGMQ